MRRLVLAAALCGACVASAHAAEVKVPSRIEEVVVFPSGAEITRTATARVEAGEQAVLLTDLSGQALGTSIRVEAKAAGGLEIASVDHRTVLVTSDDAEIVRSRRRQLEDEIEKKQDQIATLQDQIAAATAQKAYLDSLGRLPATPRPAEAGNAREDWNALFATIGGRMADASKAITEARLSERAINREIANLRKRLAELAPKPVQRTEVRVNIVAAAATQATFTVRYQVNGGSWTPLYEARMTSKGASAGVPALELVRRAAVLNRTGEDWDDVALSLSTTRPGGRTSAPELMMLSVDFESAPKPVPPVARQESFERGRQAMGAVAPAAPAASVADAKIKPDEAHLANKAPERPAEVANAPFQAMFVIPGKVSVKAAGDTKRVRILADRIEPKLVVRSVPRLDTTAYLNARMTLPKTSAPLLPGQVALFRDGTYVGAGTLPILNPGEEHELGFGPDDRVIVKRAVLQDKKGRTGTFTTSQVEERNYQITVKNTHTTPVQVHLIDRVPVSAQQDIKVDTTFESLKPTKRDIDDRRGTLLWELVMQPGEEKQIGFGYTVTSPNDRRIDYRERTPQEIFQGAKARF